MARVYNVYWVPRVPGDREKSDSYVFANSPREAMDNKAFRNVQVLEARRVSAQEEEDARKYGWCLNKE